LLIVFVLSLRDEIVAKQRMKKLKVFEILKMLGDDGWYLHDQKGSHRQFKHPTKKGKVTVNGKPSDTLDQFILNNIFKQAGWR
jgi:predicted RNA binding protein YcfA (HicA-like mRNA interferase family)